MVLILHGKLLYETSIEGHVKAIVVYGSAHRI